ncbi:acyl-CoA dehydrogenase family protein, partial [Vibrio parahaemolyticus]|uniref:acyl-CoA dehydrogenase family protein n=1 Tax=Vibrio parahaemolyticus TaxID=670 RepID=UPI001AD2BF61
QFQEERLWGAANSIEGMMRVINETIDYTRQRQLFGSTVLDQQVVHFTLAELKTEVEALRALVWQATETYVDGNDVTELASMCK